MVIQLGTDGAIRLVSDAFIRMMAASRERVHVVHGPYDRLIAMAKEFEMIDHSEAYPMQMYHFRSSYQRMFPNGKERIRQRLAL